jgi:NADPH:quinone reductase-like Zn-dependent oxidoreductase
VSTMRAVMLTKRGGPEVLETVELPLPVPGPGEVRVKVLATGVGATDITMRRGSYPYAPPIPFVPGYESVGVVEALGPGVTTLKEGDRVCALLVHRGYATHVVRGAEHWVTVPDGLDAVEVAASILNGVTAWQMIHREARLQRGQSALVNAANGGVGQMLLTLLRIHGVESLGAAATSKHALMRDLGATPVDGRGAPLDAQVRALRPDGVDAAFDGWAARRRASVWAPRNAEARRSGTASSEPRECPRSCHRRGRASFAPASADSAECSTASPCCTGKTRAPSGRICRSCST